ncbi:hypothetical protein ACVIGB_008387 [Bradyrhizobium sp. USDA 4341]
MADGTGFDYKRYENDLLRQNIELKLHLSEHWATSSLDEKLRVAGWIVKDWGGINNNSEMTILGYVIKPMPSVLQRRFSALLATARSWKSRPLRSTPFSMPGSLPV